MRNLLAQNQIIKSVYNDIIRYRLFFGTNNAVTNSVIASKEYRLFEIGEGQKTTNISTGDDVTLQECDVSLFGNSGIIPNAQRFTVMGIGIDIHLANVQATTPFSDDAISTIDATPDRVVNPYPLVDAIRSHCTFELHRNSSELLEQGNVADYPCGLYNSGFGSDGSANVPALAAGAQNAYSVDGFIMAQNGMTFRQLTAWQVLDKLDQFYGIFKVCRPIDITGTQLVGYIDFLLVGRAEVNRTSTQLVAQWNG